MGTDLQTGNDVVSFLKLQHEQIKELFGRVKAARGPERAKAFHDLRRLLAVHETAEEEIVHPVARRALPDGAAIVGARLREERAAKKALAELETLDVESAAFAERLDGLEQSVLAHAEAEEKEELELLQTKLDPERLARMKRRALLAERIAPTRPHAGLESAAANILVGPLVAVIDRLRDAILERRAS
jgi:hemerythrin superfamily protein